MLLYLTESYYTWQAHAFCLGGTNLKDWNTLFQNQLKQKPIFFHISLPGSCACQPLPQTQILVNPKSPITNRPTNKRFSKASNLSLSIPTASCQHMSKDIRLPSMQKPYKWKNKCTPPSLSKVQWCHSGGCDHYNPEHQSHHDFA